LNLRELRDERRYHRELRDKRGHYFGFAAAFPLLAAVGLARTVIS